MKPKFTLDDAFDDFGFSAVSEDELKARERDLEARATQHHEQIDLVAKGRSHVEEKLEALYKLIMTLLVNLQKNPEKEYILWPNRADKVKEFIAKVDKIVQ